MKVARIRQDTYSLINCQLSEDKESLSIGVAYFQRNKSPLIIPFKPNIQISVELPQEIETCKSLLTVANLTLTVDRIIYV